MENQVKELIIPVEVLQAVLNNLAAQPYGQVVELIKAVQENVRPHEESPERDFPLEGTRE